MKGWSRIVSVIVAATLIMASNHALAAARKPSVGPEQFAQAFYDWYSSFYEKYDLRSLDPPDVAAIKQRPVLFDTMFARRVVEDARAQSRCEGYADGLDYDPFLQVQDTGGRFHVTGATAYPGGYRVFVAMDGKPHLVAYVAGRPGRWRFTDFADTEGHGVAKVLEALKQDRRRCPKS
jgi:hypothetical protein